MSKTDELIWKLEELVEQYKAYYDSIQSPVVKITTGWMEYNNQLESEISQLKEQIKEEKIPDLDCGIYEEKQNSDIIGFDVLKYNDKIKYNHTLKDVKEGISKSFEK